MFQTLFLHILLLYNNSFFCVYVTQMSQFIVQCLNPYRKPDCKLGRISNTEDFKHLARKVRFHNKMFTHMLLDLINTEKL